MAQSVKFGGCRFDLATGQLWSGEDEVRLTPKASAVLKVLVTHAGQPVSKEHLFATVWSDDVVSDDALASCIQELRRALADDAKQPRFIETRHRRGYRFAAAIDDMATTIAPDKPQAAAPDTSTIAVLPFADMSPGRDQDYFCGWRPGWRRFNSRGPALTFARSGCSLALAHCSKAACGRPTTGCV
jgi:DNA-binding winged helix-turn-helix (wHTH) protein